MASDEFVHESLEDAQSIGGYLRAILRGLETGYVELSDDAGQLALHPTGLLGLELRAKRTGNRAKLQLELSWTEPDGVARADSLRVRSEASD
jgi:amphi-Trp domain-containing protein